FGSNSPSRSMALRSDSARSSAGPKEKCTDKVGQVKFGQGHSFLSVFAPWIVSLMHAINLGNLAPVRRLTGSASHFYGYRPAIIQWLNCLANSRKRLDPLYADAAPQKVATYCNIYLITAKSDRARRTNPKSSELFALLATTQMQRSQCLS